jgi:hypothetical protein
MTTACHKAELQIWEGRLYVLPANLVILQAAREALDIICKLLRQKLEKST